MLVLSRLLAQRGGRSNLVVCFVPRKRRELRLLSWQVTDTYLPRLKKYLTFT